MHITSFEKMKKKAISYIQASPVDADTHVLEPKVLYLFQVPIGTHRVFCKVAAVSSESPVCISSSASALRMKRSLAYVCVFVYTGQVNNPEG